MGKNLYDFKGPRLLKKKTTRTGVYSSAAVICKKNVTFELFNPPHLHVDISFRTFFWLLHFSRMSSPTSQKESFAVNVFKEMRRV